MTKTSLFDMQLAADTILRECMPAGWDWSALENVTRPTAETNEITTWRDAKRLFGWAVLNVCGVLEAYKTKNVRGSRFAGQKKAMAIMKVTRQTVDSIYWKSNGVGEDARISDWAKGAALQFAERFLISDRLTYNEAMTEFERELVRSAIRAAGGLQHRAAYGLGIHRNTISQVLDRKGSDQRD